MSPTRDAAADGWPVDPDVTSEDLGADRPARMVIDARRVAVVLAGGFLGGLTRYEAVTHWASAGGAFPWSTFTVNTAGAFILGLVVVVVTEVIGTSTYTRPLLGAGFCGALTTFSSVAVQFDELAAHGHLGTGCAYLAGSVVAGLAAAAMGALLARQLPPTAARKAISARSA